MSQRITPAPVRKSVVVRAPAARAFEVFTAGIARWWPKSHHIGASEAQSQVIEPRSGGRWFERGIDGVECEIGKVLTWQPPTLLVLAWQLTADFKYDAALVTEVEVRFIDAGGSTTRVELEHRHLERLGDRGELLRQSIDSPNGWGALLELYAHAASQQL